MIIIAYETHSHHFKFNSNNPSKFIDLHLFCWGFFIIIRMSFIKSHLTISPVLKLHVLNLEAKENIGSNENNTLALQKIEYLSKTRMFDKLLKEVEGLKDLQFPSLK